MSEWSPIDTAPKDGAKLLLWIPEQVMLGRKVPGHTKIGFHHRRVTKDTVPVPETEFFRQVDRVVFEGWTEGVSLMGFGYGQLNPSHWMQLPHPPTP